VKPNGGSARRRARFYEDASMMYRASMSPETSAVDEARRMSVDIVRRHLPDPAYRIFLFGSRARGTAHERSDIDIGIDGPLPGPYEILASIIEEIGESPTLYSVDVVDLKRAPAQFRAVALERATELA
jgi:predicted nucleotidyltransferase